MPAFEPTAEQREIVYQCSGFGFCRKRTFAI
jgi:hypothetical protein